MALRGEKVMPGDLVGVDSGTFRRGLVLGLTLAEICLLVVFVLLLALGALLKEAQARAASADQMRFRAEGAEAQLRRALERTPGATPQQVESWVRELVEGAASTQENKALKAELTVSQTALEQIKAASGMAPDADATRTAEQVTRAMAELKGLRVATEAARAGDKSALERRVVDTAVENERLKGTIAYQQRKLNAVGKGTERPACWAVASGPSAGRPEYIFDVSLTAGGIIIRDRALAHRRAEQARLPLSTIHFGVPLDDRAFRSQTRPLFEWGESRGCRFFVSAYDRTGAGEKEIYKHRSRVMEEHFYRFLNSDARN